MGKKNPNHVSTITFTYEKEVPFPDVKLYPEIKSIPIENTKNNGLEILGYIVAFGLMIASGIIVYLQLVKGMHFANWLYIESLVVLILSIITFIIAIFASLFHYGNFFDCWVMGEALEGILKVLGYLILALIEALGKS